MSSRRSSIDGLPMRSGEGGKGHALKQRTRSDGSKKRTKSGRANSSRRSSFTGFTTVQQDDIGDHRPSVGQRMDAARNLEARTEFQKELARAQDEYDNRLEQAKAAIRAAEQQRSAKHNAQLQETHRNFQSKLSAERARAAEEEERRRHAEAARIAAAEERHARAVEADEAV